MSEIKSIKAESMKTGKDETLVKTVQVPNHDPEHQNNNIPQDGQSKVEKWWLWEMFAWLLCAATLLGLIGFLAAINHRYRTRWTVSRDFRGSQKTLSITVNSVVSLFSTIVKSAVMIPVAACLSQLKWIWFSRGHKLSDFQRFEAARSGPLGSVMLLWRMRGRQLACLGALITIGSLALDFSFQQLITYPLTPRQVATAYMPATAIYSGYDIAQINFETETVAEPNVISAATIGMQNISATINLVPECSSGNCKWDKHITTLAVCSECHDISFYIQSNCTTANYTAGSAEYCEYIYPDIFMALTTKPDETASYRVFESHYASAGQSINFLNRTDTIAVLRTIGIARDTTKLVKPYGSECAFYWCANKYDVSVTNSTLSENLVDVFRGNVSEVNVNDYTTELHLIPSESFLEDTDRSNLVNISAFVITQNASQGLDYTFTTNFDNIVTFHNLTLGGIMTGEVSTANGGSVYATKEGPWVDSLFGLEFEALEERMRNIAGNMTNAVRMANRPLAGQNNTNAAGHVIQYVPKVVVVWWWIIIPAGLTALSLLFLVLTILSNSRHGTILWKSSALATFYYPLAQEGREKVGTASGPKELEKIAEDLNVKAERTDKGYRLVSPGGN